MNKEKRFLITTALEETWIDDQPLLFLGEWCRLYSRKDRWAKMNASLLPYHWDDRNKLYADYQYLNRLYERVLIDLTSKLNDVHKVDYSLRYWRILAGPWLAYFIQILFDRWLSIQSAVKHFEIIGTIVLNGCNENLIPNDMSHFADLMVSDEWNHHIYAEMLHNSGNVPIIIRDSENVYPTTDIERNASSIKNKVLNIYSKIANHFVQDFGAFLSATYLTKFNEVLLQLRLGQFPQFWQHKKSFKIPLDKQQRNWMLTSNAQSEFEIFLLSQLPKQIPIAYLEGYHSLIEQIHLLPWPKFPKIIYTSNVLWYDTVSMAYTAEKVERGTPLVYGQHGGVYGAAKFTFFEEHEITISDRYLTWGWFSESNSKVVPIGMLKITKKVAQKFNNKKNILLITLNSFRYTYCLCSESGLNFPRYFENYFLFAASIHECIRNKMLVRLSSWDNGWEQSLRWGDRFPNVQLDSGCQGIYELFDNSRIVVQTYNSTGILETLALGIPTILFCDLKVMPLRESAVPYYDELKRVGIFHDTPESAALHVNAVWDDVDAWWASPEVQGVVASFTKQYCHISEDLLVRVEATLREVIAEVNNKKITTG